jgi:RsiW-degrading membrane proteinase PrsW (M82 family)
METTGSSGLAATDTPMTSAVRILAGLGAAFGSFLILSSVCGLLAYLILPLVRPRNALTNNTLLASGITIGLLYGVSILIVALASFRGRPLPRFRLPSPLLFLGFFLIVIGLGQTILFVNFGTAYLFPPWHALASMMLPLAALAYAARRLSPAPSQAVLAQFIWGGAGTVWLALVFELIVGAFIILAAALVLAVVLGPDQFAQLVDQFRSIATGAADPERLLGVLTREPVVLILTVLAALAFFTVIGPLIEETFKGLGPGIWIARTRPTASRALLWGLAAGAGFAISENLLYGANLVMAQGGVGALWALLIVARAGTSLVHVAATATVTLGWYSAFVRGRRASFFLFFSAGFAAHGFWNLITPLLSLALSSAGGLQNASGGLRAGGTLTAVLGLAIFALLILAAAALAVAWIAWLIRWAKRRDEIGKTEHI